MENLKSADMHFKRLTKIIHNSHHPDKTIINFLLQFLFIKIHNYCNIKVIYIILPLILFFPLILHEDHFPILLVFFADIIPMSA